MQDTFGVGIRDNAAEVGGGIVADSRAKDDCFGVLLFEKLQHLLEREGAADIGIEDKETFRPSFENGISEVIKTTSGAERLILAEVGDLELTELARRVSDEVPEDRFFVVTDEDDFLDTFNLGDRFQAVPDDRMTSDIEKWLQVRVSA